MSATQVDKQFWSIERAVAFVVAPIATPLSGALALWLSRHFPGVHVTGGAVYAFAATAAGGTAAAFIKWLDGRQKFVAQVGATETAVLSQVKKVEAVLPESERAKLLDSVQAIVTGEVVRLQHYIEGRLKLKSPPLIGVRDPQAEAELAKAQMASAHQPADESSLDAGNWPVAAGVSAS